MIRRYVHVYNEALLAHEGVAVKGTCKKMPSENNMHEHFTVLQVVIDSDTGKVEQEVPVTGFHQRDVLDMTKELSKNGVEVFLPAQLELRLYQEAGAKEVVLVREQISGQDPKFYIDIRQRPVGKQKYGDMLKFIKDFPDTLPGYTAARAMALETAAIMNLELRDLVDEAVWENAKP